MFYGAVKGPVFCVFLCGSADIPPGGGWDVVLRGQARIRSPGAHVPAAKPPELCGAFAPQACRQAHGAPPPPVYGAISAPPGTMPRSAASRSLYEKKEPQRHAPRAPQPLICALLRLHPFHSGAFHMLSLQPAQRLHMGLAQMRLLLLLPRPLFQQKDLFFILRQIVCIADAPFLPAHLLRQAAAFQCLQKSSSLPCFQPVMHQQHPCVHAYASPFFCPDCSRHPAPAQSLFALAPKKKRSPLSAAPPR